VVDLSFGGLGLISFLFIRGRAWLIVPMIAVGRRSRLKNSPMKDNRNKSSRSRVLQLGRRGGVGMHLTSLPGAYGIGDVADSAMAFIDTLVEMNLGVWQFLPLGPTAYGDSPYQPLSAFAGNANLIGPAPLLELGLVKKSELEPFADLPEQYTDYGRLIPLKRDLLARAAERFEARAAPALAAEYDDFLHRNGDQWLDDYALFRVLKTAHGERPWPEWDKPYVHRDPAALVRVREQYREQIERTRITQFLFDRQWRALKAYATQRNICLFGDMPIYIALDSADAWSHPELLMVDHDGRPSHVAGVPPDYFSEDGQLWGNPLYDWAYHEQTGFQWWIERTRHAAQQAHLVRIDHFRGFESFWSVPCGERTAKRGTWVPGPGDALFLALEKALGKLPIVAEDLGVITPAVDDLREGHGIPGMVVLQFEVGKDEFDVESIGANSVCYTGTHDNDTTLGWFRGNGDDTRTEEEIASTRLAALKHTGGQGQSIAWDMIRLAFASPATLAIAPMQDYLGLGSTARLNRPGSTSNNWRWRLQSGELDTDLIARVAALVRSTSRMPDKRLDSAA
jgi:4-alpha-glucanotransferase